MLSGIANYIFGSESEVNSDEKSINLLATSAEDDWVLVDKDKVACFADMSSSSEELSLNLNPRPPHSSSSQHSSPTPSNGSRVCTPASTDSNGWYVTPPPCFTAGSPSHAMETSPLENLLIEHPSMSVYHRNIGGGNRSGSLSSEDSDLSTADDGPVLHEKNTKTMQAPTSRTSRPIQRPSSMPSSRLSSLSQQYTQLDKVKSAQKSLQRRQHRMLTRKHLEKQNKAHINGTKHSKRRQRLCKLPSGVNNNRKC